MVRAPIHTFADHDDFLESCFEKGWTDGLPVVPPTRQKVERFLAHAGLQPHDVLGMVPTREVTVYAEGVAANAVMAGCRVEYFPVVVAACRAILAEKANLHSTTATLAGAAHYVIVNGPIRRQIEVACGLGCFGPGFRANATIGRALRLMVRNICRGVPGLMDRATFSWPFRYSFCFGENEEESPWVPLHVERGFSPEQSTVTVGSLWRYFLTSDHFSNQDLAVANPAAVLDCIAASTGRIPGDAFMGDNNSIVYVVGMEHMRVFAEAGYTKQMMREYLFQKVGRPHVSGPGSARNAGVTRPEGILIVAAGGVGMSDTAILSPHLSNPITVPVEPPKTA